MSDRWSLGLVAAAALCCALPLLVTAGIVGAAWAVVREHWLWGALSIGSALLAVIWRARRADILPKRPHAGR